MDTSALVIRAAFAGSLATGGALLLLMRGAFVRMHPDVWKDRTFRTADRVRPFPGSFTVGFLPVAAASTPSLAEVSTEETIFAAVPSLFLAAALCGSFDLFLIARPPRSRIWPHAAAVREHSVGDPRKSPSGDEQPAGDENAAG